MNALRWSVFVSGLVGVGRSVLQFRESGFKIWLATNPSGVLTVKKPNYPNYLRAWKLICQVSSSGYFKSEINGVHNYFGESFKKIPYVKLKLSLMTENVKITNNGLPVNNSSNYIQNILADPVENKCYTCLPF